MLNNNISSSGMLNNKIQYVIKRNGTFEKFAPEKIVNAIHKAALRTEEFGLNESRFLTDNIIAILNKRYENSTPRIEEIQDIVEQILIEKEYVITAKSYMVYRKQHADQRAKMH